MRPVARLILKFPLVEGTFWPRGLGRMGVGPSTGRRCPPDLLSLTSRVAVMLSNSSFSLQAYDNPKALRGMAESVSRGDKHFAPLSLPTSFAIDTSAAVF